ncbi:MAG: hypothetical protein AAF694_11205 [Bacteroidota bacterium]
MEAVVSPKISSPSKSRSQSIAMPWYIYASVLSAASIVIGLIWDISWHMTIGRDSQFSSPHLLIYFGGLLGGLGGGYQMFANTFSKNPTVKDRTVKFWGFRAPLGALFAVWGALAMATSAPMDDWWHNAYGLDVKILSPPHALLALGLITLVIGSMITLLSFQNRVSMETNDERIVKRVHNLLPIVSGALFCLFGMLFWEYLGPNEMRTSVFYKVTGIIFPLFMVATAISSKLKWSITTSVLWYMAFTLGTNWILQLLPASPLLGPIHNPVDHYVSMDFPLLFIAPAFVMDLINQRMQDQNKWLRAFLLGISFFAILLTVQWFFGAFLLSQKAGNAFFLTPSIPYSANPNWWGWSNFKYPEVSTAVYVQGFAVAALFAVLSARVGISWGLWMKELKR